jgi:hypothetical protein
MKHGFSILTPKTIMKKFLISAITILLVLSCNNDKKDPGAVAGSPCTFEDSKQPIEVYRIVPANNGGEYDIIFRWPQSENEDSLYSLSYHQVNNKYVTSEQLKADSIVVGKIYQYIVSKTISGSCNWQKRISLEKY